MENFVLKVDYAELEAKAEEMRNIKGSMEEIMNNMKSSVDSLSETFVSEAGNNFIGRFNSVYVEIGDSLANLDTHISNVMKAAEEYQRVESEVDQIVSDLRTDNIF